MSLRARLTAVIVLVSALGLGVAAAATRGLLARSLMDRVDHQLERLPDSAVRQLGVRGLVPRGRGPRGTPARSPVAYAAALLDDAGAVQSSYSPTGSTVDFAASRAALAGVPPGRPRSVDLRASDGSRLAYRVLATEIDSAGSVLAVALPLDDVHETLSRLNRVLFPVIVAVLAAVAVASWWLVRLGLRPLRSMSRTAHQIASGELSSRVPAASPRTEVGALANDLNVMLDRLEAAFSERAATEERLRRFVGDASHELRTPVTAIRGYAEIGRMGVLSTPEETRRAMARIESEAKQLGLLVEDLLTLATTDEGRPLRISVVDLADIAEECAAAMRARSPEHPLEVELLPAPAIADPDRMRQVITNLLNNAAVHTPPGTPVQLSVRPTANGGTCIEVSDEGPGMDPATAERAFERFYRADTSRARRTGGTGLGLSIVDALVRAHGGTAELRSAPGRGTTVTITLPPRADGDRPAGRPPSMESVDVPLA